MTIPQTRILFLALLTVAGCSSTREIETARPQPFEGSEGDSRETARQARLSVVIQKGDTELPLDAAQLRFRVAEVQLHATGGEWIRLPSDAGIIEIERGRRVVRRTVLDTRVPPVQYDSVAVSLDRVFVLFNENAGAPLTTARDAPQRLALELELGLAAPTTLALHLEPAPSLTRTEDCRWFFIPVLRPEVLPPAGSAAGDQ